MISVLNLATESTYYFRNTKLRREFVGYMSSACEQECGEEQI